MPERVGGTNQAERTWPGKAGPQRRTLSLTLLALLLGGPALRASGAGGEEFAARAEFLRTFARYTEWSGMEQTPDAEIVIGVLGGGMPMVPDPASSGHRRVVVRSFRSPAELAPCHILYFPLGQESKLRRLRRRLAEAGVLTVGESAGFIESGGALRLFREDGRLRFSVNRAALARARIRVEPQALALAHQVMDWAPEEKP